MARTFVIIADRAGLGQAPGLGLTAVCSLLPDVDEVAVFGTARVADQYEVKDGRQVRREARERHPHHE